MYKKTTKLHEIKPTIHKKLYKKSNYLDKKK